MPSLSIGTIQLFDSLKTLRLHWEEAKMDWRDGVRDEFEKEFWMPLESHVINTHGAMEHLSHIMVQAQQDCQ
jgi:hypothetical protein